MQAPATFRVTFWGVTGSYPRPYTAEVLRAAQADLAGAAEPLTYGGDTTCVEIQAGDEVIIIDAGTGLQRLRQTWESRGAPRRGTLFLTHGHLDHVCALPFFDAFYDAASTFRVRGAARVIDALGALGDTDSPLANVFFPRTLTEMPGLASLEAIEAGEAMALGEAVVTTYALHHPGGSLAYRIDFAGKRVVIATDHEQSATPDLALARFAEGADLLYMDAQYLRAEYEGGASVADEPPQSRQGWGHTPMEDCLPTAAAAGAKRLYLGHHEPRRCDAALRKIAARLEEMKRLAIGPTHALQVELAYQGLCVEL